TRTRRCRAPRRRAAGSRASRSATMSGGAGAAGRRSVVPRNRSCLGPFEIHDLRLRADVLEQLLAPARRPELRDLALGIVEVAEDDRRRGTGLRARRLQFAVLELALAGFGVDLGGLDPLHAERAFLHDADFPDGDVGVELELQRLVPLRVEE